MTSPAWKHKQRHERAAEAARLRAAAAVADAEALQGMTAEKAGFDLLLVNLENDRKRISALPQGGARIPLKRECAAVYAPVVDAYLAGGQVYRNEVLVQLMIWRFDLGEIADAVRLAEAAVEQGQPMPERFKSTLAIFVADAVLDWAKAQKKAGGAVAPYFDWVLDHLDLWQLHDAQRAKYCKFAAERADAENEFVEAFAYCNRAAAYDPGAQIVTLRTKIEKELARRAEAARHSLAGDNASGGQESSPPAGGEEATSAQTVQGSKKRSAAKSPSASLKPKKGAKK